MTEGMNKMIPGYAYVLIQEFKELYDIEEGAEEGTLFKELNIPMDEYGPIGN